MILLEKKILSFPSIKKEVAGSSRELQKFYRAENFQRKRAGSQEKNLIDLLTSGMSNLTWLLLQ